MKFFTATIATIFAGVALAAPTVEQRQTYTPCTGLYGTSQCCATDVLGVADLDCANPPEPGAASFLSSDRTFSARHPPAHKNLRPVRALTTTITKFM
ncbi:hypothetical protein M434DRAFT_35219 [Hypoxylon sp. CO27-5]|nr:hypothetical protein M434DRAFT_35219 [Hypoxylon sp. CO27-5]